MSNEDKELAEKIAKFLEFMKKECPECYSRMKQCCASADTKSSK